MAGWLGAWLGLEISSPDFPSGPLFMRQGSVLNDKTQLQPRARRLPTGRGAGTSPSPVTLGLLDQQPGCCAEIQEHKRPHSGKGWGWEGGQPSPMLPATIRAFSTGRPADHQRLCWYKGGILGSGARRSPGEVLAGATGETGPWVPGLVLPLPAPPPPALSEPQFLTCEPNLQAYLCDNCQL